MHKDKVEMCTTISFQQCYNMLARAPPNLPSVMTMKCIAKDAAHHIVTTASGCFTTQGSYSSLAAAAAAAAAIRIEAWQERKIPGSILVSPQQSLCVVLLAVAQALLGLKSCRLSTIMFYSCFYYKSCTSASTTI